MFSEKPGAGRDSDREIAGAVLLSDSDIAGDITRHSSPNSELGIEGLAKYRPYHRHLNKDWGVFFDAEAILNSILALREQGLDGRIARGAVLHMLYYHEILHAKVEAAASWLEVVTRKEVYVPFFDGESGQGKSRRDIEEAVATWVGFEKGAEKVQGESLKKKVRDFFGESVAGLSGYGKWKEGNQKCEELATMITGDKGAKYHENIHRFLAALGENKLTNEGLGDEDVYHMTFDEDDVPLYVVGDEEFVKVLFPQGIS